MNDSISEYLTDVSGLSVECQSWLEDLFSAGTRNAGP